MKIRDIIIPLIVYIRLRFSVRTPKNASGLTLPIGKNIKNVVSIWKTCAVITCYSYNLVISRQAPVNKSVLTYVCVGVCVFCNV